MPQDYPALMPPSSSRGVARLRHHATLDAPAHHAQLASVSVGPRGEAVALWTDSAGLAAIGADDEVPEPPPPGEVRPPVSATVTIQSPGQRHVVRIEGVARFPLVQPLPDGQVLLVGARSEWSAEGPEHNATIFDAGGSPLLTACVGDGVGQLRTTSSGAVWLGYFDEGVYGNLGWGPPGAPQPIGSSGLLKMTPELEIEWRYPGRKLEPIDDCYALNLAGEVAWACPTSFAVTRVEDAQARWWPTEVPGARALVVDGVRVALVGGYGSDHDRVVRGRLTDSFTELHQARLVMPDGARLPAAATVVGQADELHVFVGTEWFRMGLED